MLGCVHWVLHLVSRRVAEVAGRHDVRRNILAAIASSLEMLGSALKPLCQPR